MRFGTDGVRGLANAAITPELAVAIGRAASRTLPGDRFLIAKDPRRSGAMVESALAAGMASGGVDVELVGVMPTPALAKLSAAEDVPAAMISASHNPAADNGIKLFAAGGRKLSDDIQAEVEAAVAVETGDSSEPAPEPPTGADVGEISVRTGGGEAYIDAVVASVAGGSIQSGRQVVIDCANGAASEFAAPIVERLGLDAVVIHNAPTGLNINDRCGSTHLETVAAAVAEHQADLGLALDGDADRVLAVTSTGDRIDGDQIMAMMAIDLRNRGQLRADSVVVTVMTNLGFRLAMRDHNINVVETPVGDRHVLEALAEGNFSLGGEQSGHIILPELATTGDGLLTAVQLLDLLGRAETPLADLAAAAMERLPQVLVNVRVEGDAKALLGTITDEMASVSAGLGDDGRLLVRPSGTEPLIRVMAEARSTDAAQQAVDQIVAALA